MTFKQFLNESMDYTKEMSDWFNKRTARHISLVQKYAKLLEDKFGIKGLVDRAKDHDQSKYEEPERTPYIFITWDYHCKDLKKEFKLPDDIKDKMNSASEHHVHSNRHHPEFYDDTSKINKEDRDKKPKKIVDATKMEDLDIAEMISDWLAMSEERGNKCIDWADKNVNIRWKFTDKQKDLIYKLIKGIEK